jgi:hypothetical protein
MNYTEYQIHELFNAIRDKFKKGEILYDLNFKNVKQSIDSN